MVAVDGLRAQVLELVLSRVCRLLTCEDALLVILHSCSPIVESSLSCFDVDATGADCVVFVVVGSRVQFRWLVQRPADFGLSAFLLGFSDTYLQSCRLRVLSLRDCREVLREAARAEVRLLVLLSLREELIVAEILRSLRQLPAREALPRMRNMHVVQALLLNLYSIVPRTTALETLRVRVLVDVVLIVEVRLWVAGQALLANEGEDLPPCRSLSQLRVGRPGFVRIKDVYVSHQEILGGFSRVAWGLLVDISACRFYEGLRVVLDRWAVDRPRGIGSFRHQRLIAFPLFATCAKVLARAVLMNRRLQ